MPAPGAQCHGRLTAAITLGTDDDPWMPSDAEAGLRAVPAGDTPLIDAGVALLELEPRALLLSAVKPAISDDGVIVRVLNPTDGRLEARLRLARAPTSAAMVRLDETPSADGVGTVGGVIAFDVPPHALRSVLIR
jgi:alpha-mannosidase